MKKLIAWFLVLAMCVSMFAACGQEATPTTTPTEGPTQATEAPEAVDLGDPEALASVLEYLTTIYKNAGGLSPKDFTRVGTVPFGTTKYEVVWTASVGSDLVNIIKNDDGMVTIDVNELCEVETPYTLTATITDAAGNSVSHSWEHILPAAMNVADILDEAYALESGASLPYEVTLTGVVVSVDDLWSEQYGNITVTIAMEGHEDRPVKCYRLAGDGAKELAVGDTITVTGTITNYKGIIEFAQGCTLDSRISGGGVSPSNREYKYIAPLNDGDRVVIYNISYMKALSCKKTGYYNVGVNVSRDAEGNLTGFGTTEVWTVRKHGKSYSFIDANGEKLALGDQYTSLSSDGSNDDWMFVRRNSTRYALQNTKRTELFLQWASTYGNFSTRSVIDPETNKEYVIGIYILAEDEVVEDTTVYFDATPVENPEAGTAYKLVLFQNNLGKELGFTGKMAGYYYGTSENLNEVVDVYLEAADGGYKIYFMDGNTKTYLNIVPRDTDPSKVNVVLETTGKSVYTLNTEHQYISTVVNDTEYYLGTYGTHSTISASSVSYIEDTSKIGVSQFPAWFATTVKADAPVEPEEPEATEPTEPSTPTEPEGGETPSEDVVEIVDAPEAGTAYKLLMDQKTNGEVLYFNGATESASVTYRLASSDDAADAVDVYLEAVSGGYRLYFMDGETKTYIRIYERTDGEAGKGKGSLELTTTAPAEVLVMDETYNTLVYVADADNSYYMGTYSTYETFSVSNYSYLSADNVDVSQFPARFALVTLADRDEPTEPEVTLSSIAVTTAPTKTEYTVGDTFDPAGLVVTATYSDGTTTPDVTDYTLSAPDMTTAGPKTVTVNYEGKEATFEITVNEKKQEEVTPVIEDGTYIIWDAATKKAMTTLSGNYGYIQVTDVTVEGELLTGYTAANIFTVKNNEDGTITLTDAKGKTLYMTGSYNSFNVGTNVTAGADWKVEEAADGTYYVTNVEKSKSVCYDSQYNTYGSYSDKKTALTFTAAEMPEVEDGTYVIWDAASGKAMTALSGNYGYIKTTDVSLVDGKITGHTAETIFTVKNYSDGTITLTDANGKTVYMTGTYNSFNVGTNVTDGASWNLENTGNDTYYITNISKNKTVAFDTSYGTFGSYSNKKTAMTFTAAEAPKEEEGGEDSGSTDTELTSATITFDDKAKRTTYTTSQQIWEENGITVTNDKASSTTNVGDYAKPARFYQGSSLKIEMEGMVKIEFTCNSTSYATTLKNSIGDAATVSDKVVTVEFTEAVDVYEIAKMTAQVRIDSITVYTAEAGDSGDEEVTLTTATITFDDKAKRTTYTTSQQIWEENGITVTNDKASSTTNVGDYAKPARFYQGSSLKIEMEGMVKIEFTCNSTSYATTLKNSIGDAATVSGKVVTVEFTEAVDVYEIAKMTAQVRVDSIAVTYAA